MSPPLVRTWSGSVIQLRRANFFRWLQGWVRWTIRLRPMVPAHLDQSEEILDPSWPEPVRPWRGFERPKTLTKDFLQKAADSVRDDD